jgi:hypothetical protein
MSDPTDVYNLRIANWSDAATLNTSQAIRHGLTNNEFFVRVPAHIRQKGKCQLTINSCFVSLTLFGAAGRIVPADTRTIYLQSNIPFLGMDTDNLGHEPAGLILGTFSVEPTALMDNTGTNSAAGAITVTCPQLPAEIMVKKYYLNADNGRENANAGAIGIVPCEINISCRFLEDMYPKLEPQKLANRYN